MNNATTNDGAKNMTKRIEKATNLIEAARKTLELPHSSGKCFAIKKAWRKASIACMAVVNNTTDHDTACKYNDLYSTCVSYGRYYG